MTKLSSIDTGDIKINPADRAVRLTTTLNLLRKAKACEIRYAHLVRALGGVSFDHDAPINLLTILDHNGVDDCLWALRATAENCNTVAASDAARDAAWDAARDAAWDAQEKIIRSYLLP